MSYTIEINEKKIAALVIVALVGAFFYGICKLDMEKSKYFGLYWEQKELVEEKENTIKKLQHELKVAKGEVLDVTPNAAFK